MKSVLQTCTILLTMLFANISNAEWSFGEIKTSNDGSSADFSTIKTLDNSQQSIQYKGKTCIVSETHFHRVSNNYIMESRRIDCQLSDEIIVSNIATCREGLIMINQISAKIKGDLFSPILRCDLR